MFFSNFILLERGLRVKLRGYHLAKNGLHPSNDRNLLSKFPGTTNDQEPGAYTCRHDGNKMQT